MRKCTFTPFLTPIYIWNQLQNKKHTPFFPGPHTTTRQLAYLRHAIFQPYANRHISSHTASMSEIQYRNVAKSTSIRTRFKSLTSIEQAKLRILKKCAMMLMVKYRREKDPVLRRKVKRKILLCINLSVGIQMDTYEPIERPVRMNISLENMTFMFSKEFLRFRKEDITDLYLLLRFRLENRSKMSGEEVLCVVCMNYAPVRRRPLCLKYLAVTQVTNVGLLITLLVIYTTIFTIW
jgi:hypothetical protein